MIGSSRLPMPKQTRVGAAGAFRLTVVSSRLRLSVRLKFRIELRCRPQAGRVSQTSFTWLCANKLRTSDGPAAQTPRSRALETWRLHRRVTMSRLAARYAQLIKMCRRRGCPPEDAKDLVQEAHRRLFEYQRSTRVRDVDSLLRRIVINLSITYFHREASMPSVLGRIDSLETRGMLVDQSPGPERTIAAARQLDRVVSVLDAVSPRTCQIFIAQRGGYSYEEIATAFGIKPRTVEKHVASAMLALREMLPGEVAG